MATIRPRGDKWEGIVKHSAMLPRPRSFTFDTEDEARTFCAALEAQLKRGVLPPELREQQTTPFKRTLAQTVREYRNVHVINDNDARLLDQLLTDQKLGALRVAELTYDWAEGWITTLKRERIIAPSTIKHYVGALARCLDWVARRADSDLPRGNPLRMLPRNYAQYTEADAKIAGTKRVDVARERRLEEGEYERIVAVLNGEKGKDRERALELKWRGALELMFDLSLLTAMRMREMYTLTLPQVHFEKRTFFLDKTKNGDKRQVPMRKATVKRVKQYLEEVQKGERGMAGFTHPDGRLFPWWDGSLERKELERITALLSQQFARVFEAAGCADFHFHDTRHEGACRWFEDTDLSDLEISLITGHKDLRMLRRYANLRGSQLALRID